MENVGLRGQRPRELPKPNQTYKPGRVCAEEGCDTTISRYNKDTYCWTHVPTRYPLIRGERKRRKPAA